MSLYPTPTRLQLLEDVEHGEVYRDDAGDDWTFVGPKVTVRVAELHEAGWIERPVGKVAWRLTAAGRAVLDGGAS